MCFHDKKQDLNPPINLPAQLKYSTLNPKYKVINLKNAKKTLLKGTQIFILDKSIKSNFTFYSHLYPWIELKYFEIIQPKATYFCCRINNKNSKNSQKILVFSNGEISNICGIIPFLIDLSSYLRVNILTYEYPKNYNNVNKEKILIQCTYSIISYAYGCSDINNIILCGQCIGVYLNYKVVEILIKSKLFIAKLKKIINISPMWCFEPAITKKMLHVRKYSNFVNNLQENTNKILKISTFVTHGVKDKLIGYMLSMNICSKINLVYEWYPKEGDHYNIFFSNFYRRKLLSRLKTFLSFDEMDGLDLIKKTNTTINSISSAGTFNIKNDNENPNEISGVEFEEPRKNKLNTVYNKYRKGSGFSFRSNKNDKESENTVEINQISLSEGNGNESDKILCQINAKQINDKSEITNNSVIEGGKLINDSFGEILPVDNYNNNMSMTFGNIEK